MSEESTKLLEQLEHLREARYQWHKQELREHLAYVMETQIKILQWIEKHEGQQECPPGFGRVSLFD